MESAESPGHPGWWARMADGGMKRLWVSKRNDAYACRIDSSSAEQEAERQRRFEEWEIAQAEDCKEPASSFDARVWASATISTLQTANAGEALAFLGDDDIAREAMRDAELRATRDAGQDAQSIGGTKDEVVPNVGGSRPEPSSAPGPDRG